MAATISQIRAAIATKLSTSIATSWNITSHFKGEWLNPPQIDMLPGSVTYHEAQAGGFTSVPIIVRAAVQMGDTEESAQDALDILTEPTGSGSLRAILEADRTLGGTISALTVTDASEYKVYGIATGSIAVGVEFTVDVVP